MSNISHENLTAKNKNRSIEGLLIGFFIPLLIMLAIFIGKEIYPFGDESFLRTDMYHQYAPFFSEFRRKLANGGSLFYTHNLGMGTNFIALYAYYLAGPFNFLIVLIPREFIIEFMSYLIVLKIACCGLSMSYFLGTEKKDFGYLSGIFGVFYALSGYMAAYSWNIMWLDCLILLPLICHALKRLIYKDKCFLYAFLLALSIFSNYYISIMSCLFLILYFMALLILKKDKNMKGILKNIFNFAFYSLIAAGIAALILIPEIYALKLTASGDFNFPNNISEYFSSIDIIVRHLPLIETQTGLKHFPNIYCGVFVFLFIPFYIMNKNISNKEKLVYIFISAFLTLGFSINTLNYIWHGLHFPNSLPARQSYVYIFVVLYMSYRAAENFDYIGKEDIIKVLLISTAAVLLFRQVVSEEEDIHFAVYYVSILLLLLYSLILYFYKTKKLNSYFFKLLFVGLVCIELSANTAVTSVSTTSRSEYISDNKEAEILISKAENKNYRFDKTKRKTKDEGAWLGFKSISIFSSTANSAMSSFYKKVGNESSTNAYSITGQTPLLDMLFAAKYAIYDSEQTNPNLKFLFGSGGSYLYENPYILPLGFIDYENIEENWNIDLLNPAMVQNDLSNILTGQDILKEIKFDGSGTVVETDIEEPGLYYAYVSNQKLKEVRFSVEEKSRKFDNLQRKYLLELGFFNSGDEISFKTETQDSIDLKLYKFDYAVLEKIYNKLNKAVFEPDILKDTFISGKIKADKSGCLFISLPYEKGWSVFVDGKKVLTKKYLDTFLSVDMEKGEHELVLEYEPEGIRQGIVISAFSLIVLILIYSFKTVIRKDPD